jgi:hypothetical protein
MEVGSRRPKQLVQVVRDVVQVPAAAGTADGLGLGLGEVFVHQVPVG